MISLLQAASWFHASVEIFQRRHLRGLDAGDFGTADPKKTWRNAVEFAGSIHDLVSHTLGIWFMYVRL